MPDPRLPLTDDCLIVEVWDSAFRPLAVISVPEFFILSEHAPWRALMGDHEMTYCADPVSAVHCRAEMVERLRPRLQDRLYTYTPSALELRLQPFYGALHSVWVSLCLTTRRLRHPRTYYGPSWKQLLKNSAQD